MIQTMIQTLVRCVSPVAISLLMALGVQISKAQCGPLINGRFGGEVSGVAYINGGAILVAQGTEVEVYGLSPQAPTPLTPRQKIGIPSPAVKIGMSVNSNYAFVLMQDGNVQVIGIGYIPTVNLTTSMTIQLGDAVDLVGDGQFVYIARLYEDPYDIDPYIYSSIEVFTVSNSPAGTPVFLRTIYPLTNDYGFDRLAKVGNVLWAGFHELRSTIFGVDGFNVITPSSPVRTGTALNNVSFDDFAKVTAMAASSTDLLVAYRRDDASTGHEENWLAAVNVATPSSPAWRPGIELNDVVTTMSVTGTQLRVALVDPPSIKTFNIANPAAIPPTPLGTYTNGLMSLRQMFTGTGTDYWAGGPAGLMTMNTLNPAAIVPRSDPFVPVPTAPKVVRQRGNTTVVLDYTLNALRLFDYTLPEGQQLRSSISLPWYSELVELGDLTGNVVLACVATKGNPAGDVIAIYDITNNTAPVLRSTISGFTTHLMSVSISRLYVFTTGEEFKIYEISQPLSPLLRSSNFHGGDYSQFTSLVSWSNNSAAIGTTLYGLWLYNTTNATAPFVSAVWNPVTGYQVASMAKGAGNWLYVSARVSPNGLTTIDTRLETLNVSNMANPTSRFVHNSALGAGSQGVFSSLSFIQGPANKFLVGTREYNDFYEPELALENSQVLYELPPGFLTSEAVPFRIANIPLPYAHGNIAYGVGGTSFFAAADEAGLYRIALPTQWAPGFGIQPMTQRPCINNSATLSAFASGNPATITYQWYRDNIPLANGPTPWGSTVTGANEPSLIIYTFRPEDARGPNGFEYVFRCVATNSCGSTSSFSAYFILCAPDYNCDRVVDFFDYLDFLDDFTFGQTRSDFNADGAIDFFDYLDFVQAFSEGC